MGKAQPIQTNFTAGEISPRMLGRVDIDRYSNGVAALENFIIMPQGGVYRRSGTRFAAELRDSSKKGRLVRFEFSTTQAYQIQFEDQKIRFYKDEGIITQTPQSITGITKANPAVVTYSGSDTYANGDRVIISGVSGMVEVNNREFTVANVNTGANTFELSGIDSSAYTTYSSGGTVAEIYEIASSYLEADLFKLQFTQNADVLFITAQGYAPAELTRTGHTAWTLTDTVFIDGPFQDIKSDLTVTPSGTTGSVTLTASSALFASTDVGRQIRLLHSSSWSYLTITAYSSSTSVTATVGSQATVASASDSYRMGAFYTANYPQSSTFHENRLVYGGTPSQPDTGWMSFSGVYRTFSPTTLGTTTVTDSCAIPFSLVSDGVNAIRWMLSSDVLTCGTSGAEWVVKAGTINEALTPSNVTVKEQSVWGSELLQAKKASSSVLFIDRSGRKLRDFSYEFQSDRFKAKDISLLSEHLFRDGDYIVDMVYQQSPDSVLWLLRSDGVPLAFTYLPEQNIFGCSRMTLGGAFGSGHPVVESVSVIPNPEGTADQVWFIVKRTINGSTKRYVEFLEEPFDPIDENDKDGMYFLDCGLTYDSSPTTSVTGLFHLVGETVGICADAAVAPDGEVSSTGKLTIDSASLVHVGLKYVSKLKTLPVEGGNPFGSAQGKQKRVHNAKARFLNSLSIQHSKDDDEYFTLAFRDTADVMGQSPPLFTGDKNLDLDTDIESEGDYYLRQVNPYPTMILALMPKYAVTET